MRQFICVLAQQVGVLGVVSAAAEPRVHVVGRYGDPPTFQHPDEVSRRDPHSGVGGNHADEIHPGESRFAWVWGQRRIRRGHRSILVLVDLGEGPFGRKRNKAKLPVAGPALPVGETHGHWAEIFGVVRHARWTSVGDREPK